MVRSSILMTVYNRPVKVLEDTLDSVVRSAFGVCDEIVVIDDGSTVDYGKFENEKIKWVRIEKDPRAYSIDGTNNPARAWNHALEVATGDIIISMASDCIVPLRGVSAAVDAASKGQFWQCRVINSRNNEEFLGKDRLAPYGWFMAWDRTRHNLIWDENYMKGIAFEDNDMTARLAQAFGGVTIDLDVTVTHQSHPQVAYSDNLSGWHINQKYTMEKWGGIPWGDPRILKVSNSLVVKTP